MYLSCIIQETICRNRIILLLFPVGGGIYQTTPKGNFKVSGLPPAVCLTLIGSSPLMCVLTLDLSARGYIFIGLKCLNLGGISRYLCAPLFCLAEKKGEKSFEVITFASLLWARTYRIVVFCYTSTTRDRWEMGRKRWSERIRGQSGAEELCRT